MSTQGMKHFYQFETADGIISEWQQMSRAAFPPKVHRACHVNHGCDVGFNFSPVRMVEYPSREYEFVNCFIEHGETLEDSKCYVRYKERVHWPKQRDASFTEEMSQFLPRSKEK